MSESLVDQILQKISEAGELYYHLILVIGPADSGKTKTLQEVLALTSAPLINVNLELSRRMLDLAERRRALQVPKLLGEIVGETKGEVVLFDNIEIFFDVHARANGLAPLKDLINSPSSFSSDWPIFQPNMWHHSRLV